MADRSTRLCRPAGRRSLTGDGVITARGRRRGRSDRIAVHLDGRFAFDLAADVGGPRRAARRRSSECGQRSSDLLEQDAPYRARERALRLLGAARPVPAGGRGAPRQAGFRARRSSARPSRGCAASAIWTTGGSPRRYAAEKQGAGGARAECGPSCRARAWSGRSSWRRRRTCGRRSAGTTAEGGAAGGRGRARADRAQALRRAVRRRPRGGRAAGWPASWPDGATTGRPSTAMVTDRCGRRPSEETRISRSVP